VRPVRGRRKKVGDANSIDCNAWSRELKAASGSGVFVPLPRPETVEDLWADGIDLDQTDEIAEELASHTAETLALPASVDAATLAAWVVRIVDRDECAFEALYDATSSRVFTFVQRITQNVALAEEAVEETFWQAWRQAPRFDAVRGKVVTWLLSMARSRAIDALRRDKRFAHDELPDDDSIEGTDDALPHHLLDSARQGQALHAALAMLDAKSRQLVSLAFLRGLTHEEIAAQTALPLGTVKSLIRRSLQQMRQVLEDGSGKP
jgi:RNA polymerase sigma-70 factor (ECF subfamily)